MDAFSRIAENRIREAYAKGDFDNIDYGKPIDNESYFEVPEEERIAFHILKNSGIVPEEVELRKNIYKVSVMLSKSMNPEEKDALRREREFMRDKLFVLTEKRLQKK